jgi:hypothetical protein
VKFPPSCGLKEKPNKEQALAVLALFFILASRLAHSSTFKMEATCSSELSGDFQRTTRRYNPEVCTVNNIHMILIMILVTDLTFICV